MLAPWFNAPLGARMVSRHFTAKNSGGVEQIHLHLDGGTGRPVPTGSQTIITNAFVSIVADDPAPTVSDTLWSDDYLTGWDIWSPEQGALTPLLPFAWNSQTPDWIASASTASQAGIVAVPCPPLTAPIIISEGHRAFVRATNNTNARVNIIGWVVGFVMPVVHEVPGGKRYFTEQRRP